jgi:hypothetical protein
LIDDFLRGHKSSNGHHSNNNGSGKHTSLNEVVESKPKKAHIKKPLNAFMLFMKEQRSQVVSECTLRESAAINQILGRKWHELERADQAKYYEMARQERLKHMQLYPGWSARDNYGLKKKRRRKREKIVGENGGKIIIIFNIDNILCITFYISFVFQNYLENAELDMDYIK